MATLLNNVTTNTVGTGASQTGPCTVFVRGVFDGATVDIQVADQDVNASYVRADSVSSPNPSSLRNPGCTIINATGTYFVRAAVNGAGTNTSITAVTT